MRSESRLVGALAATAASVAIAALTLAPATAHAFCRTTTIPAPPDFDPSTAPGDGCFVQGVPLYHQSQCVPYHLLAQESSKVPNAALSDAFAKAFGAWTATNPTCSPGITGIELGVAAGPTIVDYQKAEGGNNVFGVVQGAWAHAGGSDTLALSTLTFGSQTGEIFDADMEIREDLDWSLTGTPGAGAYDLQAVLTHEVGHILGLAHAPQVDAVMSASYSPGSIAQRTLTADDQLAICKVYPDRQTRLTSTGLTPSTPCDLSPGTGAPGTTCGDPVIAHGCSAGASGPSRDGAFVAGLGLLGALAWQLRRRRRAMVSP